MVSNSTNVIFRCDGSTSIGIGHVMRCRSLALALKERGCNVCFVMRELPGNAVNIIRESGFKVESISVQHDKLVADLTEDDLKKTEQVARLMNTDCALVDNYGASAMYMGGLKDAGIKVAVIDDMADRDLSAADWILNQNLGASALPYHTRQDCIRLFGPAYALLRPEFSIARRDYHRKFSGNDCRVLITFGGSDTTQLVLNILKTINSVQRLLDVRCVLNLEGPVPSGLLKTAEESRHKIRILKNVSDMAEHMTWADISINAGGTTCWELCCMGVPMIVLSLSMDQSLNAEVLEKEGCAFSLGKWSPEASMPGLVRLVEELMGNPERRADMSSKAQSLVDGFGAVRAAGSLIELATGERGINYGRNSDRQS